jgi:hypothetical protein
MIRINGHLGATLLSAFPVMAWERQGPDTVLTGVLDPRGLYRVLAEIEALGLDLLEVRQLIPRPDRQVPIPLVPHQIGVCPRGSAPHAPGVPQYSRFPRPAARINHDDVTLPWSGPRRCHFVVVARDSAL